MANVSAFTGAMPVIPGGLVEVGYTTVSADVIVASNSETSPTSITSTLSVTTDGGPYVIEFYAPYVQVGAGTGNWCILNLWEDGANIGRVANLYQSAASGDLQAPCHAVVRRSPSAGTHTYQIRAWRNNANGVVASVTNNIVPAFLRVSKIVNQNDGLKPFWTPPVVTQLPSQATVGDQVIYAANATDGVYWHLQYDGLGTYPWKFIGGSPLRALTSGAGTLTSSGYSTSFSNGATSLTLPLAGDYDVLFGAREFYMNGSSNGVPAHLNVGTSTPGDNVGACQIYSYNSNSTYWNQVAPSVSSTRRLTGLSALATLSMYGRSDFNQLGVTDRYINATPIRVKAA